MGEIKHTPVPWKTFIVGSVVEVQPKNGKGKPIVGWNGFDESDVPLETHKENARFIVRAVNAHDDLLAALQSFVRFHHSDTDATVVILCNEARAVIAAATGHR